MNPNVFRYIGIGAVAGAVIFAANTVISLGSTGSFASNAVVIIASAVFGAVVGVVSGIAVTVVQPVIRRAAVTARAVLVAVVGGVVFFVGTWLLSGASASSTLVLIAAVSGILFALVIGFAYASAQRVAETGQRS